MSMNKPELSDRFKAKLLKLASTEGAAPRLRCSFPADDIANAGAVIYQNLLVPDESDNYVVGGQVTSTFTLGYTWVVRNGSRPSVCAICDGTSATATGTSLIFPNPSVAGYAEARNLLSLMDAAYARWCEKRWK